MSDAQTIQTTINGRQTTLTVLNRLTLADLLRDQLGLTGTKVSCAMQVCGACTVLVDGLPVSSCTYLAVDIDDTEVLTIEGLAVNGELHPVQQAFVDQFALQCGFCTPGFIMTTVALLSENASPTQENVQHYLEGNICRCTGYQPIIKAVMQAAETMQGQSHE